MKNKIKCNMKNWESLSLILVSQTKKTAKDREEAILKILYLKNPQSKTNKIWGPRVLNPKRITKYNIPRHWDVKHLNIRDTGIYKLPERKGRLTQSHEARVTAPSHLAQGDYFLGDRDSVLWAKCLQNGTQLPEGLEIDPRHRIIV